MYINRCGQKIIIDLKNQCKYMYPSKSWYLFHFRLHLRYQLVYHRVPHQILAHHRLSVHILKDHTQKTRIQKDHILMDHPQEVLHLGDQEVHIVGLVHLIQWDLIQDGAEDHLHNSLNMVQYIVNTNFIPSLLSLWNYWNKRN